MKLKEPFKQLVRMVKNHPLLEIMELSEAPPLKETAFKEFSDYHGVEFPGSIKEAYLEMDGFTLVYKLKDESDEGVKKFNKLSSDYMVEKGPPYIVGCIKFLDFEQTFLGNTWEGILYDRGAMSDEEKFAFGKLDTTYNAFGKQLKPFDLFSEETCAACLINPALKFEVILLSDYYADWKNSLRIAFDDYWKLVFATGGLVEAREQYLSVVDGDKKPTKKLPPTTKLLPKIFKNYVSQ